MLTNKYQKRWFWGSVSLAFALLVITRFFLIPYALKEQIGGILEIAKAILDNLLAALVASISVTLLLLWLTPSRTESAIIEVVESPYIEEVLRQGRDRVTEYWYKGNTGRYFRAVTLPKLAEQARSENITKHIRLIILDPRNTEACKTHASFRQKLKSAEKDKQRWTEQRVQLELNSVIVSAYAWKAKEPLLDIDVALIDVVSFFRIDFSSRLVVITSEDERQPALMCESSSLFYQLYREDLLINFKQAKGLPKSIAGIPLKDLNLDNTKKLLSDLDLDSQNLDDSAIEEIIALSKKPNNPY